MSNLRYSFGLYCLADSGRVLLRAGDAVPATPKVLATLLVLVRAGGQAVGKDELLQAVWPDSFVEEGNLTQNISVLRKLMALDYPDTSPIETIPRFGYRFRPEVQVDEDAQKKPSMQPSEESGLVRNLHEPLLANPTASLAEGQAAWDPGISLTAPPAPERSSFALQVSHIFRLVRDGQAFTRLGIFVTSVLVVAGVVASFAIVHKRRVSAASVRPLHTRVAVLAFTNLSRSPEQSWVSDALRETLATDLGSDPDVRVLPNETVERAERERQLTKTDGLNRDTLKQICHDLDCDEVVSGSYLVVGNNVRLDTHLLDANTGAALGSYSATSTLDELLPLISQTGASVRATFGLQPASAASRRYVRATISDNPEAYKLYIEGLEHIRAFDGRAAVDLFERSIALDPQFPLAHKELSGAYIVLGQEGNAISEAHKAESLAGSLPREDRLRIQAAARSAEGHFQASAEVFRTLFTMDPENLDYGRLLAAELTYAGHPQEALDVLRPILAKSSSEAHDPRLYVVAADCYSNMGDWPSSLTWARAGIEESKRRGARVMYGRLLTTETQALLRMNQLAPALAGTQEALNIARQFKDYSGELRALNRLGQIETAMGQFGDAQSVLEQALSLEEQLGEMERQIHTLSALGQVFQKKGDLGQAGIMFQRGLTLASDYGQPVFIAEAKLNIARLELQEGKERSAVVMLRALVQEAAQLNDRQLATEATLALKEAHQN